MDHDALSLRMDVRRFFDLGVNDLLAGLGCL